MTIDDYEQEFYKNLEKGIPCRNGIRRAIDAALERQDSENVLKLYYRFIKEDTFECDNLQSILIFPEYLAYFEAHEELQDRYQHDLMWVFKWILNNIYRFHQVSKEQIERIFIQYADFCKKYNYSLRTYYEFLGVFIRESLEPGESFLGVTAKEAFLRMMKTPRDNLSDCKACELDNEFNHYLFVEDNLEKALEIIQPVFSGHLHCSEVPEITYLSLAEYYFKHGDLQNAVEYATKSYRMIHRSDENFGALLKDNSINSMIIAYHEPEKALKMIKELLPMIIVNQNTLDCFQFFRSAYNVFLCIEKAGYRRVHVKLPFRDEEFIRSDDIYDIEVLRDFMFKKAKYYADLLDARNGNTLLSDLLEVKYDFGDVKIKKPTTLDIPVLEYIDEYLDQGVLPREFSLPRPEPKEGQAQFADGAQDGISFFHMQPERREPGELEDIIRLAAEGKDRLAVSRTEKYFEDPENRAFYLADSVQEFILDHRDELDPNQIYNFGIGLIIGTRNYEAVKLGLIILEIFSDYNDKLLEAIMKLSACDEFSLYCIWAVKALENGNDLIFEIAKNTFGWGKIFAVYYLEADTDEIREWLLYNGIHNDVHPGYLANKCFDVTDVRELLRTSPDITEMQAIAYIIYFLLEEGPCMGINAYEDKEEIIDSFLDNADRLSDEEAENEDYNKIIDFVREYQDKMSEDQ